MKVCVMSPARGSGQTSVAVMLASSMASIFKRKTILTHTDLRSPAMLKYSAPHVEDDPTKSITQVVRLLETGSLNPDNLIEYATELKENLYLMDSADQTLTDGEYRNLISFLVTSIEEERDLVVDLSAEIYDEITGSILKDMDFYVIVLPQNIVDIEKFKLWLNSKYLKDIPRSKMMFVANRYHAVAGSLRNLSSKIGVKHNRMCKISYNPHIMRMGNMSQLTKIHKYIIGKDARYLTLYSDMQECMQVIGNALGIPCRWR